jgi:CRISPR-associated protein Cas6
VSDPISSMLDLAFAVDGGEGGVTLPREHRRDLADALERALPWLATQVGAGIHRLNVSAGGGPQALLSGRTRLTLRVPRERADEARALEGRALDLAGHTLQLGAAHVRELLPWGTLYAHVVAADEGADELAFLQVVQAELVALGITGRPICGRPQVFEADRLRGYSLMLDGLSAEGALRLLEAGLGPHRRLGCGLFVPHKSAAAVGAPP